MSMSWRTLPDDNGPTKDDEGQLQPDDRQSVEQEGSDDTSNIAQRRTDRHSQVPEDKKQQC